MVLMTTHICSEARCLPCQSHAGSSCPGQPAGHVTGHCLPPGAVAGAAWSSHAAVWPLEDEVLQDNKQHLVKGTLSRNMCYAKSTLVS